ncbi:MAG: site-specific integrase [Methylotenera sp.]
MATITKSNFGSYRTQIRRVGQPSIYKSFKTKAEAEEWCYRIEYELTTGQYINRTEAERITLSELIDRYLCEVSVLKKGHKQEVPRLLNLKKAIGHYRVLQIQSKHIAQYRDSRINNGKSSSTILNELSLISQVFDMAIKEWSIPLPSNPCKLIKKPKPAQGRERRLGLDEEHRLISACKATRAPLLHPLVVLALETGMRLGELLSLTWDNVDTAKRVAHLPTTKNGERRTVPLSSKAIMTLSSIPRNITSPRVFWTWSAKDGVANVWRRTCNKAKIEDLHFHDLRHEATSRFFEHGLSMMEVACITGHKTLQMLKRYTHLKAEDLATKLG